ncbi:hypothetical protein BDZ88DRAFT_13609 [Geranomyces variabilis]|nr:hypothetical protein BDZ88DRAFT_13609 [Geranomyces variabilis]KAJ3137381.1 hypothetical protein HDU90_002168 [Geranomyces variabilis]
MSSSDDTPPPGLEWRHHDETYLCYYRTAFALVTLYYAVTIPVYYWRRKSPHLAGRLVGWSTAQAIASYLSVFFTSCRMLFPVIPCFVQLWGNTFCSMLWCALFIARSTKFYFKFKISHAKLFGAGVDRAHPTSAIPTVYDDETASLDGPPTTLSNSVSIGTKSSTTGAKPMRVSMPPAPSLTNNGLSFLMDDSIISLNAVAGVSASVGGNGGGGVGVGSSNGTGGTGTVVGGSANSSAMHHRGAISPSTSFDGLGDVRVGLNYNWYWKHRDRVSNQRLLKIIGVYLLILAMIMIIVQIKTTDFALNAPSPANEYSCLSAWEKFMPMSWGLFFFEYVLCPVIFWRFRRARDNYGIRVELALTILIGMPCCILYFLWARLPGYYIHIWPTATWYSVSQVLVHTVSMAAPVVLSYRTERIRKRMVFLYNMESFTRVLSEKVVWDEFKVYMAADFCVENALFYEAYQELIVQAATAMTKAGIHCPGMPVHGSALAKSTIRGANLFSDILRRRPSNVPTSANSGGGGGAGSTGDASSIMGAPMVSFPRSPTGQRLSTALRCGPQSTSSGVGAQLSIPRSTSHNNSATPMVGDETGSTTAVLAFSDQPVPEAAKQHYKAFYDTYLEPGAPYEVNLPSSIRDAVASEFLMEKITVGVFDAAKEEVVQSMFLNTFPNFLHASQATKAQVAREKSLAEVDNEEEPEDSSLEAGTKPARAVKTTAIMLEGDSS